MINYSLVVADLRERAQRLNQAADALEAVLPQPVEEAPSRPSKPAPPSIVAGREEKAVLDAVKNGATTPKAMQVATGIPKASMTRLLRELTASNRVTKTGKTLSTRYSLV